MIELKDIISTTNQDNHLSWFESKLTNQQFQILNNDNISKLNEKSGIYFYYYNSDLIYIGKSFYNNTITSGLKFRMGQYLKLTSSGIKSFANKFSAEYSTSYNPCLTILNFKILELNNTKTDAELQVLERYLIYLFNPKLND